MKKVFYLLAITMASISSYAQNSFDEPALLVVEASYSTEKTIGNLLDKGWVIDSLKYLPDTKSILTILSDRYGNKIDKIYNDKLRSFVYHFDNEDYLKKVKSFLTWQNYKPYYTGLEGNVNVSLYEYHPTSNRYIYFTIRESFENSLKKISYVIIISDL